MRTKALALAAFLALTLAGTLTPATAHVRHYHHYARHNASTMLARGLRHMLHSMDRGDLVTVQTAAGIPITVAASAADKFKGFIGDLVAEGHKPHDIGCYAHGGHIAHSFHYRGLACDIDQDEKNVTASYMYHVSALASKWGLDDGCEFHDCGHISLGEIGHSHYASRERHRHYAQRRVTSPRYAQVEPTAFYGTLGLH